MTLLGSFWKRKISIQSVSTTEQVAKILTQPLLKHELQILRENIIEAVSIDIDNNLQEDVEKLRGCAL